MDLTELSFISQSKIVSALWPIDFGTNITVLELLGQVGVMLLS